MHSLISGNLMDVCPVGAITTRDYRFKSRPWDNPNVVDTMCTLCSKGCNTSAWLKAKPEWAKGSRLIRMTPRFNPDVNSYWMCDIGRFDYHWVEGETRLRKPMQRRGDALEAAAWHDVEARLRDALSGGRVVRRGIGPIPGVRARVDRGAVRAQTARRRTARSRRTEIGLRLVDTNGKEAAGRHEVQGARRPTLPT